MCASLALIALAIQLYLQYREEKKTRVEQEKNDQERDKKMDEILRRLPKRRRTQDAAMGVAAPQEDTLADRVETLAHEYYVCLKDGASPSVYESRLKPQLVELLPELQKANVKANISETDIEPQRAQLANVIRYTADKLVMVAINLAYPKYKIEGSYLVQDEE